MDSCQGKYKPGFAELCEKCPNGTYSSTGQTACTNCPHGKFNLGGSDVCDPCLGGKYIVSPGSTCVDCASGTWLDGLGSACILCRLREMSVLHFHLSSVDLCQALTWRMWQCGHGVRALVRVQKMYSLWTRCCSVCVRGGLYALGLMQRKAGGSLSSHGLSCFCRERSSSQAPALFPLSVRNPPPIIAFHRTI
jgi:hypothetical protein